jgi:hypothetical protein
MVQVVHLGRACRNYNVDDHLKFSVMP